MRRRIPPLNPLRAFEVAARHSNLSLAAQELSVTQGAVSRQIKVLEDYLGFELFARNASGMQLTDAGRAYARALGHAFDLIDSATDDLRSNQSSTVLTVQGFNTFLSRWLVPRLPDFHRAHPNIRLRLVVLRHPTEFSRGGADLAILYGTGDWSQFACDLLFTDELLPVCSPALIAPRAGGVPVGELASHVLLHQKHQRGHWRNWLACAGEPLLEPRENLYFEDLAVAYQCAIEGLGVAIGQRAYLRQELAAGALVTPFDTVYRPETGYYLARVRNPAEPSKISLFREWLLESLRSADRQA